MLNTIGSIQSLLKRMPVTVVILVLLNHVPLPAQPPMMKSPAYINHYAPQAVEQMVEHGIPASVILAQAIFESNCGTSKLAVRSNNHFGIKCHLEWMGDTIVKTDDTLNECFRKYNSVEESYTDHSLFLKSRPRYASLFKLSITDYKSWCEGLKASGYATYPWYAEDLIEIIERNKLYELDGPEALQGGVLVTEKKDVLKRSLYSQEVYATWQIIGTDALFVDERDVLIRSIEMLIEPEEEPDLADAD